MNTTSKVVLGILGAAAAGAVIGMLCAPEKGTDLRNKIASGAKDWAGEFADWLHAKGKDLKDMKSSLVTKAEDLASEAGNEWKGSRKSMS
ncbi:YtxH domain-containing protein [Flavihumibacter petaseus]|uniref:YtxH domain-containing protein n=1 Tax=Flavihumibacter petaseus NBRC 106054 TaxID=1220578 RepID=A0A0E9MXW0_9BACT|nr:YtxH domain-containing protein [Flavihumibacter petaseus]GAO42414.1 hypothetical protein FPE01S_01_14290 [Flavihumibacter petaseus NBRC 106054]